MLEVLTIFALREQRASAERRGRRKSLRVAAFSSSR